MFIIFNLKSSKSFFYKLILSYCTVTIITVLLLTSFAYTNFSASYNRELENLQTKILEQINSTLEKEVIERVNSIYLTLQSDSVKISEDNKWSDIMDIHSSLVNQIDDYLIYSIGIYDYDKKFLISTEYGFKTVGDNSERPYNNLDWIKLRPLSSTWLSSRDLPKGILDKEEDYYSKVITYVNYIYQNKKLLAVDIREKELANKLRKSYYKSEAIVFILDSKGKLVTEVSNNNKYKNLYEMDIIENITRSSEKMNSFEHNINNTENIISYIRNPETGWKIVMIEDTSTFYKRSNKIIRDLFLITIVILFIGLIISIMYSIKMYEPLKTLVNAINPWATNQINYRKGNNEYTYLSNAFNHLVSQVKDMETTLLENRPLILYHFIHSLMQNQITKEEIEEQLTLLNFKFDYDYYNIMIIRIHKDSFINVSPESQQYIMFQLIDELSKYSNPDTNILPTRLSDNDIGILVNQNPDNINNKTFFKDLKLIIEVYVNRYVVSLGTHQEDLSTSYKSFNSCNIALKYTYFYPKKKFILASEYIPRESSQLVMHDCIVSNYAKSLKSSDISLVEKALTNLVAELQNKEYSLKYANQILLDILFSTTNYLKQINYKPEKDTKTRHYEIFNSINNIDDLVEWLLELYHKALVFIKDKQDNQPIVTIKNYIETHLAEDVSLDFLADMVKLKPNYLGKLFKNETGVNFSEYVTTQRLEKSKELLLNTDESASSIGAKVGYKTPTYFSRKFKEYTGYTPGAYRKTYKNT